MFFSRIPPKLLLTATNSNVRLSYYLHALNSWSRGYQVKGATGNNLLPSKEYHDKYVELALTKSEFTPEEFWGEAALKYITWFTPPQKIQKIPTFQEIAQGQQFKWFENGKLNACYNCIDRHIEQGRGKQIAIYYEGDDPNDKKSITYNELLDQVSRFANVLKAQGVQKGDCVTLYLPNTPELVIAMLACARIGAVHSVVFGGFSAKSLAQRIQDSKSKLLVTARGFARGGKYISLQAHIDLMLRDESSAKLLRQIIWVDAPANTKESTLYQSSSYYNLINTVSNSCACEIMDSEDPLFILYSSGSTGKPKGLLHTTGGYMVGASMSQILFNPTRDTNFIHFCTANMGWITGHTYGAYSLSAGHTIVMHEGTPIFPSVNRWFEMLERYQVNSFYTAPTALRLLRQKGVSNYLLSRQFPSLKILGSVGEPIDMATASFFLKEVGKNSILLSDTYWQTELGGIVFVRAFPPNFSELSKEDDIFQFSLPGTRFAIVDQNGKPIITPGKHGELVLRNLTYPSMARTIINESDRYKKAYLARFPGCYNTGDSAYYDNRGNMHVVGRADDAFNVSGHLLGSAEIEEAINRHPAVAAVAVVPKPDKIVGDTPFALLVLKSGVSDKDKEECLAAINGIIKTTIGQFACLKNENVVVVPRLPTTGSGKVMRRIIKECVKSFIEGRQSIFGDLSTLSDPASAGEIKEIIDQHLAKRLYKDENHNIVAAGAEQLGSSPDTP